MAAFTPADTVAYLCSDGTVRSGSELKRRSGVRPRRSLGRLRVAWTRSDGDETVREAVTSGGYVVRDGRVVAENVTAHLAFDPVLDPGELERAAGICERDPERSGLGAAAADCAFGALGRHASRVADRVNDAATLVAESRLWGGSSEDVPVGTDRQFEVDLGGTFESELADRLARFPWCGESERRFVAGLVPGSAVGTVRLGRDDRAAAPPGRASATPSDAAPHAEPDRTGDGSGSDRSNGSDPDGEGGEAGDDPAVWFEEPDIDFGAVAAMDDLKERLRETVIYPLQQPDLYDEYGLGTLNGVLLYGPPGTGKTYVSRALAGELGYEFLRVTPANITSKYVGEAASKVSELFETAHEHEPCLVFIDELDAIGTDRSHTDNTQSERQMQNQLLMELADVEDADVVVLAATNKYEELDSALTRSGRFDEHVEVPLPDADSRMAILFSHLADRPLDRDAVDEAELRELTAGMSASDMAVVADGAARAALREHRETGTRQPIRHEHLLAAIAETVPGPVGSLGDAGGSDPAGSSPDTDDPSGAGGDGRRLGRSTDSG